MTLSHPKERRRSELLRLYWEEIRGDRLFPCETKIDPEVIGAIWHNCYLLQVRDIEQVEDYNFTYLGNNILQAYNDGILDEDGSMVVSPNASRLSNHFDDVLKTKKPYMKDDTFISAHGNEIQYRQAILPVGSTDEKIEALFGCMFFKES